jgi:hypothetical protein
LLEVRIGNREAGGTDVLRSTAEAIAMHDTRMTPDFNYPLERSLGGDSRLHATETRPRVCEPSGKARLTSEVRDLSANPDLAEKLRKGVRKS